MFAVNMEEKERGNYRLTDHEIFKIKLSLSSLTNRVVICRMVAKLYIWKPVDCETWTHLKTGVPVLVVIQKDDEMRSPKQTELCLVDRDTGFATWRECLSEQSDYKSSQKNFHTFKILSSDDNAMAGVKFPSEESAAIFMKDVLSNLPDEYDSQCNTNSSSLSSLTLSPKHGKEKLVNGKRKTIKKIKKDEISSPCMFTHVTSINNIQVQPTEQKGGIRRGFSLSKKR